MQSESYRQPCRMDGAFAENKRAEMPGYNQWEGRALRPQKGAPQGRTGIRNPGDRALAVAATDDGGRSKIPNGESTSLPD
jgi:hypothetical protein